jgi:hypothetical protein
MYQLIQSLQLELLSVPSQDGDPDIQNFQSQSRDQLTMLYHLLLAHQVHSVTAMEILSLSLEFKNQLKILDQVILVPTSFHL